jgi:hypothetical protein
VLNEKSDNYDAQNKKQGTPDPQPRCQLDVIKNYQNFTPVLQPQQTKVNVKTIIDSIRDTTQNANLQYTVFATLYIATGGEDEFLSYDNNFSNTTIDQFWGDGTTNNWFKSKQYMCISNNSDKKDRPYVSFETLDDCVGMLCERWKDRVKDLRIDTPDDIAKFWILNNNTSETRDLNVYTSYNSTELDNLKSKIKESFEIFNPATGNVTNTQPEANVPQPPPGIKIVNLGTFNSLQGNDTSYYNIQQNNGKFIVLRIDDPNYEFKNEGDTDFKDGNNNIVTYNCLSGTGSRTCTVNGKNPGIYTMNVKYYPKGPLESEPFTLVSAPFTQ